MTTTTDTTNRARSILFANIKQLHREIESYNRLNDMLDHVHMQVPKDFADPMTAMFNVSISMPDKNGKQVTWESNRHAEYFTYDMACAMSAKMFERIKSKQAELVALGVTIHVPELEQ